MCTDSVTLFSERSTAPTTNEHLVQRTQLNRQSARNKTVTRSKEFFMDVKDQQNLLTSPQK